MNVEQEIIQLKKRVEELTRENNELKRLVNDHAPRINTNTTNITQMQRNNRSEFSRILSMIKRLAK